MVSYTSSSEITYSPESTIHSSNPEFVFQVERIRSSTLWFVFAAAIFLVSVPVFIQAPLVRFFPWLSLLLTPVLVGLALRMLSKPKTQLWGDLLLGFAWTWLSGSIYWGWFRWEPFLHLPIEAIALPIALWGIARGWSKVGHCFYLGSLFGTAITDVYFYLTNLIPYWRRLMQVEPDMARSVFQSAIGQVSTSWGISWAVILIVLLLAVAVVPLQFPKLHCWAFSGAVLSTILVDGLFWLAACLA